MAFFSECITMIAPANNPFKISATVFLCSSIEFKLNITTPKLSHATRIIGAPLGKGVGGVPKEACPPRKTFLLLIFFIIDNNKKNEEFKVFKTEIQYPLCKKSFLNITSNILHNWTKISLYNRHQTPQWLCFSIKIMGQNIISLTHRVSYHFNFLCSILFIPLMIPQAEIVIWGLNSLTVFYKQVIFC